jgi:dihydrofolate reductase
MSKTPVLIRHYSMSIIVIQFVTFDGVIQDPSTDDLVPGGWAFRYGPRAASGDKFKLGPLMETGTLLFGRRTWEMFSHIWPSRTDDFSMKMNNVRKLVVSKTLESTEAWQNSVRIENDLLDEVRARRETEDLIVVGSESVVQELMRNDLVDEYRLLVFPIVLGKGRRLFPDGLQFALQIVSAEQSGEAALLRLRRAFVLG